MSNVQSIAQVASTAATLTSSISKAMGPAGMVASPLLGMLPSILELIYPEEFAAKRALTIKDLDDAVEDILRHMGDTIHLQTAEQAAAKVRSAYQWYQDHLLSLEGRSSLDEAYSQSLRNQLRDAGGPNSQLREGLSLLENLEVGKYQTPMYGLGAGLLIKFELISLTDPAYKSTSSVQWKMISDIAARSSTKLIDLITSAERAAWQELERWKASLGRQPGSGEWTDQRDKCLAVFFGTPEVVDEVKSIAFEFQAEVRLAQAKAKQAETFEDIARFDPEKAAEVFRQMKHERQIGFAGSQ